MLHDRGFGHECGGRGSLGNCTCGTGGPAVNENSLRVKLVKNVAWLLPAMHQFNSFYVLSRQLELERDKPFRSASVPHRSIRMWIILPSIPEGTSAVLGPLSAPWISKLLSGCGTMAAFVK